MAATVLVGTDPRDEQLTELATRIEKRAYRLVLLSGLVLTIAIAVLVVAA